MLAIEGADFKSNPWEPGCCTDPGFAASRREDLLRSHESMTSRLPWQGTEIECARVWDKHAEHRVRIFLLQRPFSDLRLERKRSWPPLMRLPIRPRAMFLTPTKGKRKRQVASLTKIATGKVVLDWASKTAPIWLSKW